MYDTLDTNDDFFIKHDTLEDNNKNGEHISTCRLKRISRESTEDMIKLKAKKKTKRVIDMKDEDVPFQIHSIKISFGITYDTLDTDDDFFIKHDTLQVNNNNCLLWKSTLIKLESDVERMEDELKDLLSSDIMKKHEVHVNKLEKSFLLGIVCINNMKRTQK